MEYYNLPFINLLIILFSYFKIHELSIKEATNWLLWELTWWIKVRYKRGVQKKNGIVIKLNDELCW